MRTDGAAQLERFRRYLAERGLPATKQRLVVAEVVCFATDQLSAEDVSRRLADRGAPIGTATVYRTLALLVESGLVREQDFGEGFRRFEAVTVGEPREHCICTACGRVSEFSSARLAHTIAEVAAAAQFRPHRHRLEVYGLCRGCQQFNPLAATR